MSKAEKNASGALLLLSGLCASAAAPAAAPPLMMHIFDEAKQAPASPPLKMHVFDGTGSAPRQPVRRDENVIAAYSLASEGGAMRMAVFQPGRQSGIDRNLQPDGAVEHPGRGAGRETPAAEDSFEIDFELASGYRQDRLNFNIAAPTGSPDVLSELEWHDLAIHEIKGRADISFPQGIRALANVGYGWIHDGENQDSDYFGDNRTLEFSRSDNAADDGHVLDASLGVGYRFAIGDPKRARFSFTPLAGYSYHEQNLRMSDGYQTVSLFGIFGPLGPFDGLDSSYDTRWSGPWLGWNAEAQLFERLTLYGTAEYHWADYHAEADWNLRRDLSHPKSFKHDADAEGVVAALGGRYAFTPNWALAINLDYRSWWTESGKDTIYPASGGKLQTRLNEVEWESFGINLGLEVSF